MEAVGDHAGRGAVEGRIGLRRETTLPPLVRRERREQQRRRPDGHLVHDRPRQLGLPAAGRSAASSRTRRCQTAGSCFQLSITIVGLAVAPTAPNEIA